MIISLKHNNLIEQKKKNFNSLYITLSHFLREYIVVHIMMVSCDNDNTGILKTSKDCIEI